MPPPTTRGPGSFVAGLDLAALRKTQLFAAAAPHLLDKLGARGLSNLLQQFCQIDLLGTLDAIAIGASEDGREGAMYLEVAGLDRDRVGTCAQRLVQVIAGPEARLTLTQTAHLTEVSDGKVTRSIGWAGPDVLVFALRLDDRPMLLKWMSGHGALATSGLGVLAATTDTAATAWIAADGATQLASGTSMHGGYGAITLANGRLDVNLHAILGNDAQAATTARSARGWFDAFRQGMHGSAPALADLLAPVAITASHADVVLTAHLPEQGLIDHHVVDILAAFGVL